MPKKIELSGVVGYEITAKGLKNKLVKDDKNIVYLDSVGGSVFEGNRLYNLLNDSLKAGYDIDFVLGAVAASAASYFPLAVGKDRIKVRENTVFMGHKAWSFAIGNADDMKAEAEILDGFDKMIAKVYSKVNGMSVEDNLKAMGEEFWLMGGQSVVDAGYASGIAEEDEAIEGEEETSDPVDKSEIQAKIKEAKAVLREKAEEEDLEKWAAKLKDPVVDEQGQFNMFENAGSPAMTPGSDKENIQEDNMDFMSYLDQNPEHKAKFEELKNAHAEDVKNSALSEDRARSMKIAKLYGNSEMALNAIGDGTSVGDLAVAEKEKALEASKNATKETGDLGGLDKSKNGLPEKAEESTAKSKDEKAREDVKAYLEKNGGIK